MAMVIIATSNHHDALDIVQDAMVKLVQRYSNNPVEEWRLLFFRILQNLITDHHRRTSVKNRLFGVFSSQSSAQGDEEEDAYQNIADSSMPSPEQWLQQSHQHQQVLKLVEQLPLRQQQAFLLRAWEGMNVKETALTMSCSEGSVKTHYSRAISRLKNSLNKEAAL